jgi:hypothetical protein
MIEKIIIQEAGDVHSIWVPERRSMASFLLWKAYGLGRDAHWLHGRITLGAAPGELRYFQEFPFHMEDGIIPKWADRMVERIDVALPSAAEILLSLDPDSTSVLSDPPAFRIPASPNPQDVAACLLASRLLLKISDELLLPAYQEEELSLVQIDFASKIAIMIGGEASALLALAEARSPSLCEIIPEDPKDSDDIIEETNDE